MKKRTTASPKRRVRQLTKAVRGLLGRIEKATPAKVKGTAKRGRRKARR